MTEWYKNQTGTHQCTIYLKYLMSLNVNGTKPSQLRTIYQGYFKYIYQHLC
jgi:hypothetical protein